MGVEPRRGDVEHAVRLELERLVVGRGMDPDNDLAVEAVVGRSGVVSGTSARGNGSGRDQFWKHRCLAFGSRGMLRIQLAASEAVAVVEIVGLDVRVELEELDACVPWPLMEVHLCLHHAVLVDLRLERRHGCVELGRTGGWRWTHQSCHYSHSSVPSEPLDCRHHSPHRP